MAHWFTGFVLALFALSSSSWAGAADPYETLSVLRTEKKPAPDFSLPSVDGKLVKLSSYKGKVVLLEPFFSKTQILFTFFCQDHAFDF